MTQQKVNVLFTSAGRRVELVDIFQKEGFYVCAADCDPTAPTLSQADKSFTVPRILDDPDHYIDALLDIVKRENIDVVIPLIDTELSSLAKVKQRFSQLGAVMMISSSESVGIAFDKYRTFRFFREIGLDTPDTYPVDEVVTMQETSLRKIFPALLKPRFGSAGIGIINCADMEYIRFLHDRGELANYLVQKKVAGQEVTTDIFGDGTGGMVSAVQRKRLKIRAGEVERGVTINYALLGEKAQVFCRRFMPYGTVNIQCFYDEKRAKAYYIEINPRFGGGYPLAYHAGANFPAMVKQLIRGEKIESGGYDEGLIMSRYDWAIYFKQQ